MEAQSVYERYIGPLSEATSMHSLMGIPFHPSMEGKNLVSLCIDKKTDDRTFRHSQREACPYSHLSIDTIGPHRGNKHFSYGARFAIDRTTPLSRREKLARMPEEEVLYLERFDEYEGLGKVFCPELLKIVGARLYPEKGRLHDVSCTIALDDDWNANVRRENHRWHNKDGSYQIAGLYADNCGTYGTAIARASGYYLPPIPYPAILGKMFDIMGQAEDLTGLRLPGIYHNSHAKTEAMFRRAEKEMSLSLQPDSVARQDLMQQTGREPAVLIAA